jgi:hypothetical protein
MLAVMKKHRPNKLYKHCKGTGSIFAVYLEPNSRSMQKL